MSRPRSRVLLTALAATCGVAACNATAPTQVAANPPHVVASTAMSVTAATTTSPPPTSSPTTPPAQPLSRPSAAPAASSAAPAVTASAAKAAAPAAAVHDVTLAFAGDVHFMGLDANRLAAAPATAIGPMASVLSSADLAMVNLETAVTTRGVPAKKKYVFRAPPTAFDALRAAGIDVVTMANNHAEDYGPVGLQDSLAAAQAAHFPVVGIGQDATAAFAPYQVTVKGRRIAVIGATQVLDASLIGAWSAGVGKPGLASAYDVPRLAAAVKTARTSADLVVVYLHWGKEMSACPTYSQRTIAQQLVDAGADVVVGSHAHVLLGAGRLGNGYVDYGLGNFVFYAGGGATAQSGVLLLTVRGRQVTRSTWVPATVRQGIPMQLEGKPAADAITRWDALRTCTNLRPG